MICAVPHRRKKFLYSLRFFGAFGGGSEGWRKNRRDHAVRRRYAARATGVAEAKASLTVLKPPMTIAVGGPAYAACFEDMLSDCSCAGASLLGASKLK